MWTQSSATFKFLRGCYNLGLWQTVASGVCGSQFGGGGNLGRLDVQFARDGFDVLLFHVWNPGVGMVRCHSRVRAPDKQKCRRNKYRLHAMCAVIGFDKKQFVIRAHKRRVTS